MTNADLTAGDFQALTGLSSKALRLYAERGILEPSRVDASSGYRYYSRPQLHRGMTVDLLRRAQVPLAELGAASAFDFERWRQEVVTRRMVEDFHLAVAERVAAFDPDELTAHRTDAEALDWVGIEIELRVPEDQDDRVDAFTGLAEHLPELEAELSSALRDAGVAAEPELGWTAMPDTERVSSRRMLLVRAVTRPADAATRALVAERLRGGPGLPDTPVEVVHGTLPRRVEIVFAPADPASGRSVDGEPSIIDDAASGYLEVLAFERHLAVTGDRPLRATARSVASGPSLLGEEMPPRPVSVFDVHPTA